VGGRLLTAGERKQPALTSGSMHRGNHMVSGAGEADIVAVTLPVRNGAEHLQGTMDSLLNQSHRNIRLLVCDNASTDDTPDIVSAYARRDSRVKLQRFEESVGIVESHNRAWAHTDKSAQFYMLGSDDDYWEPEFIAEMVAALKQNPTASLAFCYSEHMNPDGSKVTAGPLAQTMKPEGTVGLSRLDAVIQQIHTKTGRQVLYGIAPMHVAIRRRAWINPRLADDLLPMMEAAWMGDIVIVPKVLFRFRLGGLSSNRSQDPTSYAGIYHLDGESVAYIEHMIDSVEDRDCVLAELQRYIEQKNERRSRLLQKDRSLWKWTLRRLRRLGAHGLGVLSRR
jgi:glycosyltransferase involved in cell wall biosynthesis